MYCLWFGNKKIHNLNQLIKYFDFDAVEMYYLGGGLSHWLRQCGEEKIASKVEKIDPSVDISKQLAKIFSIKLPKGRKNALSAFSPQKNKICADKSDTCSYYPELNSFKLKKTVSDSFNIGLGSFNALSGSFSVESTSFMSGTGSFSLNSFSVNSFLFSLFFGSFQTGSFQNLLETSFFGSFALPGSFSSGNFSLKDYSFISKNEKNTPLSENKKTAYRTDIIQLSPEEKIKLNITVCPLNRFGYGIDLI